MTSKFVSSNILLNKKINRSGVIPFVITKEGRFFLLLAKDSVTGELGDFGGGSKYEENGLQTAKREFEEETRGIFKRVYRNLSSYLDKITVLNENETMAITFLKFSEWWLYNAKSHFHSSSNHPNEQYEISDIQWVEWPELVNLVNKKCRDQVMWVKVRRFFKNNMSPYFMGETVY